MTDNDKQLWYKTCEHKFAFRGLHVEGKKTHGTGCPMKTLYEVYFCEKCLITEKKSINGGYHIDVPVGASTSGYGFK